MRSLDEFLPHLARLNPAFDASWVTERGLRRALRPADRDRRLSRSHPALRTRRSRNLWVASMFQVYPHDRGQNYSIALAERLVERIGPG